MNEALRSGSFCLLVESWLLLQLHFHTVFQVPLVQTSRVHTSSEWGWSDLLTVSLRRLWPCSHLYSCSDHPGGTFMPGMNRLFERWLHNVALWWSLKTLHLNEIRSVHCTSDYIDICDLAFMLVLFLCEWFTFGPNYFLFLSFVNHWSLGWNGLKSAGKKNKCETWLKRLWNRTKLM